MNLIFERSYTPRRSLAFSPSRLVLDASVPFSFVSLELTFNLLVSLFSPSSPTVVVGIILLRHFLSMRRVRRASTPGLNTTVLTSNSEGSAMILGVSVALVIRLGLFGLCVFAALM